MTATIRAVVALGVAAAVTAVAGAGLATGVAVVDNASTTTADDWFGRQVRDGPDQVARTLTVAQTEHLLDRQARRFAMTDSVGVATVPFTRYRLRLAGAAAPGLDDVLAGRFRAATVINYRLAGEGVVVGRSGRATFTLTRHGWDLTSIVGDRRDLWEHEAVDVVRAGRSAVIGSTRYGGALAELTDQVEQARNIVADFWDARWPAKAVVVLPGTARTMNPLVGHRNAWRLPAITSWETGPGGPVARVTINPKIYYSLPPVGQQIILRHEITHLAQDALPARNAPLWLSEGLAEYVGYRGSGVSASVIAGSAFAQVRAGSLPTTWPTDDGFAFGLDVSERTLGYEFGWAACQMIAEEYGEDSLVPFYRSVVTSGGGVNERIDAAATKVLGVDGVTLLEQWRSWLVENA